MEAAKVVAKSVEGVVDTSQVNYRQSLSRRAVLVWQQQCSCKPQRDWKVWGKIWKCSSPQFYGRTSPSEQKSNSLLFLEGKGQTDCFLSFGTHGFPFPVSRVSVRAVMCCILRTEGVQIRGVND